MERVAAIFCFVKTQDRVCVRIYIYNRDCQLPPCWGRLRCWLVRELLDESDSWLLHVQRTWFGWSDNKHMYRLTTDLRNIYGRAILKTRRCLVDPENSNIPTKILWVAII